MKSENLKKELNAFADFEKAKNLQRFFKTGKGQYGEGDIFIGIIVPDIRKVAKKFIDLPLLEIKKIIASKIHEERLCALLILVEKFRLANLKEQKKIFNFYIKNAKQVNNWDLVDLSAYKIVGEYLFKLDVAHPTDVRHPTCDKNILYKFAKSKNLWKKRIAIISTFTFIKNGKYEDTFKIAEILMNDKHDLIHKAVGWMLREVGKKSLKDEENFLKKYFKIMPRTMLRYSLEKFSKEKKQYLKIKNIYYI